MLYRRAGRCVTGGLTVSFLGRITPLWCRHGGLRSRSPLSRPLRKEKISSRPRPKMMLQGNALQQLVGRCGGGVPRRKDISLTERIESQWALTGLTRFQTTELQLSRTPKQLTFVLSKKRWCCDG